ncbi:VOC family protein [Oceanobacillus sp. CFH 90083]|uniref:VOC family protein n=1 Tax=Oceanobacillus sp. CFH 90083 TaxID=2592336 RepID=UPI0018844A1A|nr:VOC family protein [Oceanobacillus sp. CFH 90083]
MNPKIDIVTISVEDLEQSTVFYKQVFTFLEDSISEGEDHVALFLEGEMSLVLYERTAFAQMTGQPEGKINASSVIFSHMAKNSEAVDSILSSARHAGGTIVKEGKKDEWGYTGIFKDLDGYTWEVMSSLE